MPNLQDTNSYRDVEGFPGYRVGSDGSVWSARTRRPLGYKLGSKSVVGEHWRQLRPQRHSGGYLCVGLWINNRVSVRYVHRLVLEAFAGHCPSGMQGCHGDGDKSNNRIENLRWDTPKENQRDRIKHGTGISGERVSQAKITESDVRLIRSLHKDGERQCDLADRFGLCRSTVCTIISRKRWKHVHP